MSDEEINIAIAEACGFKRGCFSKPFVGDAPDYCHDLNAMDKAEAILLDDSEKWNEYVRKVFWIQSESPIQAKNAMVGLAIHATARQRAEGFLRTIGKWTE